MIEINEGKRRTRIWRHEDNLECDICDVRGTPKVVVDMPHPFGSHIYCKDCLEKMIGILEDVKT